MPTVSADAHLSGPVDYNKMPLAPLGCEAQVYERQTNGAHGPFILLMSPQLPHKSHLVQVTQRHCSLQTQRHHKSYPHPCRQTHESNR
ncbi:hypothetical protein ACHAW6_015232 [Cyclotella cf. meneghiniana]